MNGSGPTTKGEVGTKCGLARSGEPTGRAVIITSAARREDPGYIRELLAPGVKLICADAGAEVALGLGLRPDLVVGDFDSLDPATLERVRATCRVRSFPVRKDKTDTHLALESAREFDPAEVVICGAFGDRLDHTLGLVLLLAGLEPGPRVWLAGAKQQGFIVHGRRSVSGGAGHPSGRDACAGPHGPACRVVVKGRPKDTVSLLPLSPVVTGVTTEGLGYPLSAAALRWGETLGVSNEMLGTEAAVTVENGTLLVVHLEGAW